MIRNWLGGTIASKLLLAFFSIFITTYLVTALVVQSAVRTAVTDSELAALSQLAHLKLGSLNTMFEQLAINLRAWTKLDVMNDLASGDVDKRVGRTLEILKKDYDIKGEIYAFNAAGSLVAASTRQHKTDTLLPGAWKQHGKISFVNKHTNPFDGDDIVALVAPVTATFSANYQLGTLVLVYHWSEVSAALPDHTLLLYHQDLPAPLESVSNTLVIGESVAGLEQHPESIVLLESTLGTAVPNESLFELVHREGWMQAGNNRYLVNRATENTGLLSGWEVVMLREPEALYQTVNMVILKLAILCLVLALPLIFAIRWLARRLTAPLRKLTQFVSEITGTNDLSKRLELDSNDEIGVLANNFNSMTARLAIGLETHREDEIRLRSTIETAMDAVVQIDDAGTIIGWNSQAEKIFGWSSEEAIGRVLSETIIPPQYREAHVRGLARFLLSGEEHVLNSRIEVVGLHRDGREFPIELSIAPIQMVGKYEFSAFIRDITKQKESEELIWKQANFDALTGLPNRHMFYDRLTQEIKKAHRAGLKMAVMYIDLDKFKEVNDTLGHSMGDILLKETARRISDCVREADTVARLGGDEFIIILSELNDANIVERVAESILHKLAEPFHLGDEIAHVSASMGITLYPEDATGVEELLKDADQALYVAKNAGRNRLSYFTPALEQAAQSRLHLLNDLHGALAGGQFRVYFQPIVNLVTGCIDKAEALIRWQHPQRGMVSPALFIPLAEETGLIIEIGDWVFRETAQQVKRWRALYNPMLQISVNKSPMQFSQSGTTHEIWLDYLQELGLPGQSIAIEITEGLLLDAEAGVTNKLFEFRNAGVQVSIDDFGTGYSSLSYLKKFDIDYLKIDQSFVRDLVTDSNDMALSEAIIVMAHKLGLKVIAEGVETEAQRGLLSAAGCDYAQGYLFSRPVPAEEFEKLLKDALTMDSQAL